jgi:hypothetical protein
MMAVKSITVTSLLRQCCATTCRLKLVGPAGPGPRLPRTDDGISESARPIRVTIERSSINLTVTVT